MFPRLQRLGFNLTFNHFYEPIPDLRVLPEEVFERDSELVGVDMRERQQLELLARIEALRDEYARFDEHRPAGGSSRYFQHNLMFERVDAEVLHALIRMHKPRRMIEIGAGFSTLIAAEAIRLNERDDPGRRCELISVDPYPHETLRDRPDLTRLAEVGVEELPLDFFSDLGGGDIVFIDSTHVVKIASDAQYELLELLPRVAPGVLVHIHDVYFPREYPRGFVMDWHMFWNEQYVVQAFLAFNSSFAVRWSSSWMAHRHPAAIREAFPSFGRGGIWPSSLWIERLPARPKSGGR